MDEIDGFLSIDQRISMLREKEETRRAVWRILELVADVADYIANRGSLRAVGALHILLLRSRLISRQIFSLLKSLRARLKTSRRSFQSQ